MWARVVALVPVALLALAGGCTTGDDPAADPGPASTASPTDPTGEPSAPSPSGSPTPSAEPTLPAARSPYSLPALMAEQPTAGRIRRVDTVLETADYTRYAVTYRRGDVTVSGVLLVPRGRGPFPGVVLNHGYIEPSVYVSGQGLSREQDYLARAGFVVLHTDYSGHAGSDPPGRLARETRLAYTRDTIAAVLALRREPRVDPDRIAMLGRSMGGGVTLNALVAQPGLVRAAVVFAPVSSDYLDNLRRWTLAERPEEASALFRRFGTPRQSPAFYDALSARTYFDRITEPVLIHHGTADVTCPLAWSRTTHRLLERAGVRSRLEVYPGEQHAFGPQWPASMERTVQFLHRRLGA